LDDLAAVYSGEGVHRDLTGLAGLDAGAIVADPGLAFRTWSKRGEDRTPQAHYRCDSLEELCRLPVASIAARDCFLFLWVPKRSVFLVKALMEAWGFRFSGSAFTWIKLNSNFVGTLFAFEDFFMGGGYGTRQNSEICWLGRRGTPRRLSKGIRELIIAARREHSRKPDEIYARVEKYCAGPYVELFARQQWPGWHSWGDQVDLFKPKAAARGSSIEEPRK
jgi:N6-adenosine-specific RNA methylase IME4